MADRGVNKRAQGRQIHEENIRKHERAAALSEQRLLNRPSHMRHTEVLRTGHDVISNQVFTGREGRPPPQPRARPPVPVWDRVSGGGNREVEESAARGDWRGNGGGGGGVDDGGVAYRGDGGGSRNDNGRRDNNDGASSGRQERSTASRSHHQQQQGSNGETATMTTKKQVVPQLELSRQLECKA